MGGEEGEKVNVKPRNITKLRAGDYVQVNFRESQNGQCQRGKLEKYVPHETKKNEYVWIVKLVDDDSISIKIPPWFLYKTSRSLNTRHPTPKHKDGAIRKNTSVDHLKVDR